MNSDNNDFDKQKLRDRLAEIQSNGSSLYEAIVQMIEEEIKHGQLQPGERLSPIRQFSEELGVGVTTVAAAYRLLGERQHVRSEVGRGTFVTEHYANSREPSNFINWQTPSEGGLSKHGGQLMITWHRRALKTNAALLKTAYPDALDCTVGRPDSYLLPLNILKKCWQAAVASTTYKDLQYGTSDPISSLSEVLLPRLAADGIPAQRGNLIIGSSSQQFQMLIMQIIREIHRKQDLKIGVEEPGYATIYDTFERSGHELIGISVDEFGAVPGSLQQALDSGIAAVVLTPRAHNPTGASWNSERFGTIANILALYPNVFIVEDDHFADVANSFPGSLISDTRLEDRTLYIRSFSKSIAPDLRLAVSVARSSLRAMLSEAKTFADGWSSRLAQRALALALSEPELDTILQNAKNEYAARCKGIFEGLKGLNQIGGIVYPAKDGPNIWIKLPPQTDALEVVDQTAKQGVLISLGEPFFIRPGHSNLLRCSVAHISSEQAVEIGRKILKAIQSTPFPSSLAIHE